MDNNQDSNKLTQSFTDIRMPLYALSGLVILTALILSVVFYLPNLQENSLKLFVAFAILLFSLFSVYLANRGNTVIGSLFLCLVLYISATVVGFSYGGLRNPTVMVLFILIIPISSLYLGRVNTIIAAVLIILGITMQYFAGALFGLENLIANIDLDDFIIANAAVVFITAIIEFSSFNYFNSLRQAENISKELVTQNRELMDVRESLEEHVSSRTADLEKRNAYLEAIQTIARDTSAVQDMDQLIQRTVHLIAQRFDFYHVGIFLIDQTGEWADLKGASSTGGQQMIARGHRLQVGRQGIVGFVTGIGLPRISQDIALDRIHTTTAELPDTRSEMALPLKARGQIIGALDIQDSRDNAFSKDDVTTLQVLADQIALAISNARLFAQAEDSLREVQRAYGELNQKAWVEAQRSGKLPSYRFVAGARTEAARVDTGTLPALEGTNKLAIPIRVRGQDIGSIDIAKQNDAEWSEEELEMLAALSEQLGVALDSARLFDETQQRAASEALISDISAQIRESLDMESILRTAAAKIREAMQLPEVTVRMTAGVSSGAASNGHNGADPNGNNGADADETGQEL